LKEKNKNLQKINFSAKTDKTDKTDEFIRKGFLHKLSNKAPRFGKIDPQNNEKNESGYNRKKL